ncbi:guanine nucleotide exchange factor, putative [Entamoeba invadens IP1]|uniref:Guanine nucleotide exchange factor, putative n=1 Tax=Entamoeba invadens IP1 TaxID=370355 RepID=A0A0A1TYJ6_ENTIV|nr:guanine nucleotide exchange factor, putative [Entamoeba invadens IP1]ELP84630.1 guanine nucleotide exchange factor, putative [Entamoeba invadens IP1]|eukprot:XP_004183976.1 guanine nucleotide exchange factor, putative [Entamoeba invadens IP1]
MFTAKQPVKKPLQLKTGATRTIKGNSMTFHGIESPREDKKGKERSSAEISREEAVEKEGEDFSTSSIIGDCPHYIKVLGTKRVLAAGDSIFYMCDDSVYYSTEDTFEVKKTNSISRSAKHVEKVNDSHFFILDDKLEKGVHKSYSSVEGIIGPKFITSYDKSLFVIDKYRDCYEITKHTKTVIRENVIKIAANATQKGFLYDNGRIEVTDKSIKPKTNNIDVIAGKREIWGFKQDGTIESMSGIVVNDHKMLRLYSGYEEMVGVDENDNLCNLRYLNKIQCKWEVLGKCDGSEVVTGKGFVILGEKKCSNLFVPFILQVRKFIAQAEVFLLNYKENKEEEKMTKEEKRAARKSLIIDEHTEVQNNVQIALSEYKTMLNVIDTELLKLHVYLTQLHTQYSELSQIFETITTFFNATTKAFIALSKTFVKIQQIMQVCYQTLPNNFKQFEEKITPLNAKNLFDRRTDILTVLFSPFKFLSESANFFLNLKTDFSPSTLESILNKSTLQNVCNLLEKVNERMKFGLIYTWNSWHANEKGRMVMSTGTFENIIEMVQSDLSFEPEFKDVFINTITLYFPTHTILQRLFKKKGKKLNKNSQKKVLELIKRWIETSPEDFEKLDEHKELVKELFTPNENDTNEDLKKEIEVLIDKCIQRKEDRAHEKSPIENTFEINDIFVFGENTFFAEIMNYVHKSIFNKISEHEIVHFFKKENTPNIKQITTSFNWLSEMLSKMINGSPLSIQTAFLNFVIQLAETFYQSKNYFGLCAIVFAFHKIGDFEYMKTNLSKETQDSIERFEKLCSFEDNYKNLRNQTINSVPPIVPFGGIMTKDFLVTDEIYASFIKQTGQYNINKLRTIHKIAQQYKNYQDKDPVVPKEVNKNLFKRIKEAHGLFD